MKLHCIRCGKVVTLQADAIYTPDGPLCDGCSGEKRDANGHLISVKQAERSRACLTEIIVVGFSVIFSLLFWAAFGPYLWRLLPW